MIIWEDDITYLSMPPCTFCIFLPDNPSSWVFGHLRIHRNHFLHRLLGHYRPCPSCTLCRQEEQYHEEHAKNNYWSGAIYNLETLVKYMCIKLSWSIERTHLLLMHICLYKTLNLPEHQWSWHNSPSGHSVLLIHDPKNGIIIYINKRSVCLFFWMNYYWNNLYYTAISSTRTTAVDSGFTIFFVLFSIKAIKGIAYKMIWILEKWHLLNRYNIQKQHSHW